MLNTIQMIIAARRVIATYELLILAVSERLRAGYRLIARLSIAAAIASGMILPITAVSSQAQDLPSKAIAQASANATGWWLPASAKSSPTPRLALGTTDHQVFPMAIAVLNLGRFWLTPASQNTDYSFLPGDAMPHVSYLSLFELKYQAWESNLAETRTLTDVNSATVYPLIQIDYANWHFPIAMAISPLRGSSDVR